MLDFGCRIFGKFRAVLERARLTRNSKSEIRNPLLVVLCSALPLFCQPAPEDPVGLVLVTQSAKLIRADTLTPFTAKTGDILFQGDSLLSSGGTVSFLYCPDKSSQTLSPDAAVLLGAKSLRIKSGRVTAKTNVNSCWLPKLARVAIASQQQYGISLTRPLQAQAPGAATFEQRLQALPDAQRTALIAELAPIDARLAANPNDAQARIERASLLDRNNLRVDAAIEYRRALQQWPGAVWILSRLFALEDQPKPEEPAPPGAEGKTYALLVGVSQYKSDSINPLLYATRDALLFQDFLKSDRGGALPDSNIALLTDNEATTPQIKIKIVEFLKTKATKNDTVILFIAAHGTVQADGQAFIVTHDTEPENLNKTALAMADLQVLFRQQLSGVRRALLYLDTCHAGKLGEVGVKPINDAVEPLAKSGGEVFSFLASGKGELSEEGPEYGGGHGAFSYFVVDGLNGSADEDKNDRVDFNEFVDFVRNMVKKATNRKQNPKEIGDLGKTIMSEVGANKSGVTLARWPTGVQLAVATPPRTRSLQDPRLREFDEAIAAGRLLPEAPQNAFDALSRLRGTLAPLQYLEQENKLRATLEDRGRETLLRYLKGEQVPQKREDFLAGAAYFTAAQSLSPESVLLESEKSFCLGRAGLFEPKDYNGAASLLERSARLDPSSAYSYNALGIAYLERAEYAQSILAFRDAIRRAPYWTYPVHNLALAYTQTGAYARAIETYRQAMRLAPRYSYLPYNLGLLYQRLNRNREAEASYRKALSLSPDLGEPYNALGYLNASLDRDKEEAERLYRQALAKNPDLLSARQNLAVLLAQNPQRMQEALTLWQENLAKEEGYLPSRLSLARALARLGRNNEAAQQYAAILTRKPDYVAARLALADLKAKTGDSGGALADLQEAAKTQPGSEVIYEQIGDLEKARGNNAQATKAYETALGNTRDRATTKRLRAKLRTSR
jgi:tetratricopeptide (TPR) repeat protein